MFSIKNQFIEIFESFKHLGHVIRSTAQFNDDLDIINWRLDFIGQVNQ
jgi:hypothetical protein